MITSQLHDDNESQSNGSADETVSINSASIDSTATQSVSLIDSPTIVSDESVDRDDSIDSSSLSAPFNTGSTESIAQNSLELDEKSQAVTQPFIGRWNTLISQTNWEKGRIISEWRGALVNSGASQTAFSDETWSKQVGAVTSQHVGRLRRVFDRFGSSQSSYTGLYWSHFLAALDWDDAELWLEGASRSGWSISEMRKTRWENSGSDPRHAPKDEELITSEVDDDYDQLTAEADAESDREENDRISASGPLAEGPDFGDEDALDSNSSGESAMQADDNFGEQNAPADPTNPFAVLPDLPPDVSDALESFKLCIVRHRAGQWAEVPQSTMLNVIEALRQFTLR